MKDKPLAQKDPVWNEEVLRHFTKQEYELSLENSLRYHDELPLKEKPFTIDSKDRATVFYTVASSAFGVLEKTGEYRDRERRLFFEFLEKYVECCKSAAERTGLAGWHDSPPKNLLSNCLELLCRFDEKNLRRESERWTRSFCRIDAPGWGCGLALPVLREKIFNERIKFERPAYVENTRALCETYLVVSEDFSDRFAPGRTQVMNVLADLAYFEGGEDADERALEWVRRSLEINPEDRFAVTRKKLLEERQTVMQQIRRFNHDTGNAIAGINNRMDWLLKGPYVKNTPAEPYLKTIRKDLHRIHSINRFIQDIVATPENINPVETVREILSSYHGKAEFSIEPESAKAVWNIDGDYLGLAVDNIVKNAVEAFQRRKIPLPQRKILIEIDIDGLGIAVVDNAGGVDPEYEGRMFEPYVSSKGIKKETGLGLASARMAVEKIDGELLYPADQPENGARFEIHLKKGE